MDAIIGNTTTGNASTVDPTALTPLLSTTTQRQRQPLVDAPIPMPAPLQRFTTYFNAQGSRLKEWLDANNCYSETLDQMRRT